MDHFFFRFYEKFRNSNLKLYERLYVFANIGFPCFLVQNPKSPQLDCIIIQSEVHHLLKKSLR